MTSSDWIAISGLATGLFVTIIGSVWHLSHKLGALSEKVSSIEKILDRLIDISDRMRIEMTEVRVKLDILWRHHFSISKSPVVLNEEGRRIIERSNIRNFIDDYYPEIVSSVRQFKPDNAYQAQEILISVVSQYKKINTCRATLQQIAFSSGSDVDTLLFVAALSIRDRVIQDLGFGENKS